MHVDVRGGADHALGQLEKAGGAHEHAAGRALDVAGAAHRNVETQGDGVGEGELDLVEVAAGAENAEIGDHAAARADERDGFLGRELALLIQPFLRMELVALAEERRSTACGVRWQWRALMLTTSGRGARTARGMGRCRRS